MNWQECKQLNTLTAQRLGWTVEQVGEWWFLIDPSEPKEPFSWQKGDEEGIWDDVPEYCTNLFYAMSLIEHKPFVIRHVMDHEFHMTYVVTIEHEGTEAGVSDDSLPTAIVKCWLKLAEMVEHEQ